MSKEKKRSSHTEEYGMELGDINAIKYYEISEQNKKEPPNQKDTKNKSKRGE